MEISVQNAITIGALLFNIAVTFYLWGVKNEKRVTALEVKMDLIYKKVCKWGDDHAS